MRLLAGSDLVAIGGDDLDRLEGIDGQAVLARQPADPATERQAGDADRTGVAERRCEPVCGHRIGVFAGRQAWLRPRHAAIRIDVEALHRAEVEDDPAIVGAVAGEAVPAAANRQGQADLVPRAAAHIDEQIAMVRALEEQGHTYVIDDGVYFDVSTFPRYAEFAGLDLDELATSGRVEHVEAKRHPADFALWKLTPPGVQRQQEWDSPWGRGFPGWHIECSAMATKYLGDAASTSTPAASTTSGCTTPTRWPRASACSTCTRGCSIWMHNEFLDLGGEKISKSKGHVLVVDTLVERGFEPLAFRYFFLQAHYRQQQAFTWEAIEAAATAHRRLVRPRRRGARRRRRARPGARSTPHLRAVLVGAGRRPQRAPGAGRGVGRRARSGAGARPTCGRSSPTPTGPSASAWPTAAAPDADESGSDPRVDALVAERAGRAGGQGLRHLRPHPRRAGRRGDRAGRHPDGPDLAPGGARG